MVVRSGKEHVFSDGTGRGNAFHYHWLGILAFGTKWNEASAERGTAYQETLGDEGGRW